MRENGFFDRWGGIVGFFGGVLGAISITIAIWDRFVAPELEMVEVLPVAIAAPRVSLGEIDAAVYGISAIVRCRAGSRAVFISGLDLVGKKYLTVDEYLPNSDSKKLDQIAAEVSKRRPYHLISWSGWPEDQGSAVRLEPYEERYIRFVFLPPERFEHVQFGGAPHLGYEDSNKPPERIHEKPSLFDIFKLRPVVEKHAKFERLFMTPYGLRDDFGKGALSFQLRIGSKLHSVPASNVVGFRLIKLEDWKKRGPQELFQGSSLQFKFNPKSESGKAGQEQIQRHLGIKPQ